MLAVNGYYNGINIVLDKEIDMEIGQRLLVVLETPKKNKRKINLEKYVTTTERGKDVESYMKEMRDGDRI